MRVILEVLDFFTPRFCTVCNVLLTSNTEFICDSCKNSIEYLNEADIRNEYQRKFNFENFVDDYTSLYQFEEEGSLQKLVHALKYNKKFKIGIYLGKELGYARKDIFRSWDLDFIIPVPLYKLKKVERTFNQSLYIAKGVKSVINIPIENSIVLRKKNTVSQTTLSLEERKQNLNGAFLLRHKKKIESKNILIVDDVITTGATVREIAKILKENGANKIFAISVATPPFSHTVGSTNPENH
ncbi:MAG: ComF family protein [Bacteroidota bacterium]